MHHYRVTKGWVGPTTQPFIPNETSTSTSLTLPVRLYRADCLSADDQEPCNFPARDKQELFSKTESLTTSWDTGDEDIPPIQEISERETQILDTLKPS